MKGAARSAHGVRTTADCRTSAGGRVMPAHCGGSDRRARSSALTVRRRSRSSRTAARTRLASRSVAGRRSIPAGLALAHVNLRERVGKALDDGGLRSVGVTWVLQAYCYLDT